MFFLRVLSFHRCHTFSYLASELLIKHGAQINVRDIDGVSPLMMAVENNRFEVAKLLLDKGADITGNNKKDENVLHLLVKNAMTYDIIPLVKLICSNSGIVFSLLRKSRISFD
jgi:ankyrin repeat protein